MGWDCGIVRAREEWCTLALRGASRCVEATCEIESDGVNPPERRRVLSRMGLYTDGAPTYRLEPVPACERAGREFERRRVCDGRDRPDGAADVWREASRATAEWWDGS